MKLPGHEAFTIREAPSRLMHKLYRDRELQRFIVVGGTAFITNTLLLVIFHGVLKIPLLAAQICAAELSIIVSFTFHHHWTYKHYRDRPLMVRFFHFNGSALGGQLISTLTLLFCVHFLHLFYLLGLVFGASLALFWNYFANKYFIWANVSRD